jgi:hypothetical protein
MALERRADPTAGGGQVVAQEIVRPAERVEQVAGSEVDVGLVGGVAPGFVVDRGEDPPPRGGEVRRLLLHGVGKADAGDRKRDGGGTTSGSSNDDIFGNRK